jgi:hypothetical protein
VRISSQSRLTSWSDIQFLLALSLELLLHQ